MFLHRAGSFKNTTMTEQPINTDQSRKIENWQYGHRLDEVLQDVRSEVAKAKSKFPVNFHNQHEAYAVILEEVDELWDEIKKNQKVYDLDAQRKEAIQAAAMLCRLLVELL